MRTLKTSEAAAFLNVSPNTLRSWERRFGFPRPRRSPGQHRLYTYGDVTALRDALLAGLSISSAISVAQEGLQSGMNPLLGALAAFDGAGADGVMESTLALRSIEATVEEVLLPALDQIADRQGADSAPMAFAARWANDWLRRAARHRVRAGGPCADRDRRRLARRVRPRWREDPGPGAPLRALGTRLRSACRSAGSGRSGTPSAPIARPRS